MKIYTFLLFLFSFIVINQASAQQEGEVAVSRSRFIPYLVGGVNWAGITGVENREEVGSFATYNIGVGFLALIQQPAPLSLTVETFFSQQGYKLTNPRRGSSPEFMRFSYINIPAVLRFNLSPKTNFYAGVGPQVGFMIDSHVISRDGEKDDLDENNLNKTSFDAIGSFGTYFGKNEDMGFEIRYQAGLNKFMNNAPDFRHSVLQLRLIIMPTFINQLVGR